LKIVEIDKIDTHITQIHDRSLYRLGTDTSIKKAAKGGGVKLVLWAQTSPVNAMMLMHVVMQMLSL
jgi:ribosomal protein L30E